MKRTKSTPAVTRRLNETYLYRPAPPLQDAVKIGWAYPAKYPVAMSSLGYLNLFRQFDENPGVSIQRITSDNLDTLYLADTDMIGFSFSFELDIIEMVHMLERLRVPFYASERHENIPLVFAGGPVVTANPEPYAPFFDFFVLGEGEEVLQRLVSFFQKHRHTKKRRELLIELAKNIPGIYVPSLYEVEYSAEGEITAFHPQEAGIPVTVKKQSVSDIDSLVASTPILTPDAVFSNRFIVEVMRGCAHRCRFCLASYGTFPPKAPLISRLIEKIKFGLGYTNRIGLLGALISDHPGFAELCAFLRSVPDISISAASIRADTLTPAIAETLRHGGQKTITIAVETGSEQLRSRINKHLKTDSIYNAASVVSKAGIAELKLYIMVGLPGETWQDLEDTVDLIKNLKKVNPGLRLSIGCSTFVPKASTPFQWSSRESTKDLEEKLKFLRKSVYKFSDFKPSSPGWDYIQAVLSRGDRRLAPFIMEFVKQGGNLGALGRIAKNRDHVCSLLDLPSSDWYALRERKPDEVLPWDMLDQGISKETLYRESGLQKAGLATTGGQADNDIHH